MTRNSREIWIDNVKVIACLFVLLGHFFQSMVKVDIISRGSMYGWFNNTIYMFHVQLFFICSGYLYQKYNTVDSFGSWKNNVTKKLLALGVPYFVFSVLTWGLKFLFSSSVNNQAKDLLHSLFVNPEAPYWYLYCLFFIFMITPTFSSSKKLYGGLTVALVMKILSFFKIIKIPVLALLLNNEIWFVIGMCLCWIDIKRICSNKKWRNISVFSGALFLALSLVVYLNDISFAAVEFLCGLIACFSIILFMLYVFRDNIQIGIFGFLSKYTMPIFLMHTVFAATFRTVLLKLGIHSFLVHTVVGISVSIIGPILAALVMQRFKWLNFILYPNKVIRSKKQEKLVN